MLAFRFLSLRLKKTLPTGLGLVFLCIVLLVIYSGMRVLFFELNRPTFAQVSPGHIRQALWQGVRFDLSSILLLNLAFVLGLLLPLPTRIKASKAYARACACLFLVPNIAFFYLNVADVEYFKFTGKRSTFALFQMLQDIVDQSFQLLVNFWHVPLIVLLLGGILYFAYQKVAQDFFKLSDWSNLAGLVLVFAIAPFVTLGIRGGLQSKPLSTAHAQIFDVKNLNVALLNSTFTMLRSSTRGEVPDNRYFNSWEEVVEKISSPALFSTEPQATSPTGSATPTGVLGTQTNVVILLLESFSQEYMGRDESSGFTPFLNSLSKQGVFLKNNFANGRRSIDAVTSVLSGLPALMDEPFVSSPYQNNELSGLGTALKAHGYSSAFYHGGKNGTMYFDVSARMAGMENYFGLSEYPEKKQDHDGTWGIFDEPYLQYCAKMFGQQKSPFLAAVFTLSSHNPYTIPAQHQGRFTRGKLPILQSIEYADYALQKFFETASRQPWYSNTLFVLTGDHTSVSIDSAFQNDLGSYRVPLVFFHPTKKLPPVDQWRVTQHADILPSVLDLLGVPQKRRMLFGHSVFDASFPGRAVNFSSGTWWLAQGENYLRQVSQDKLQYGVIPKIESKKFDTANAENLGEPLREPVPEEFKLLLYGTIQYFNQGLRENRLLTPP